MIGAERLFPWPSAGPRAATAPLGRRGPVPRLVVITAQIAVAMLPMIRPTGPGNSSPVDLAIALFIGCFLLWTGWAAVKLRAPYWVPWGLLIVGAAIGALNGGRPTPALLDIVQDAVLMLWVLALVNMARYPETFKTIVRTWAVAAPIWAGVLIVAYFGGVSAISGVTERLGVRAGMLFADPNMAANYWAMSAMIVAATRYPFRRWLRVLAYLTFGLCILISGSNGGAFYLGFATLIVVIGCAYRRHGIYLALAIVLGSALVGGAAVKVINPAQIESWAVASNVPIVRDSFGRANQSLGQRTELISETLALLHRGGIAGLGPNTTIDNLTQQQANFVHEAHDDYIEALVERGLVGFIGIVMLVGSIVARTRAFCVSGLSPEFEEALPNRVPLVAALLGLGASATFYQVLHFRHGWLLLSIVGALYLWGRKANPVNRPAEVETRSDLVQALA